MTVEIPGYRIIRTLGQGGMATVYLAEQEIFEREVALKIMSSSLDANPLFGKRFLREAKIVSHLVHPNIVTVHDVGVHKGICYLSMEYIDGNDLKYACRDLSIAEKISVIRDISKALNYAGSKGYIHRDIKPENIMLHLSDKSAVLTDFGIARAAESSSSVTQTGATIGTPHYMSPEQARGLQLDTRSDIYSLGVVFYVLLTGRVPYDAESAVAIGIKHITEPVPLLPSGFEALQSVIDHMMAKKVEHRFENALEIIEALDHIDIPLLEQSIDWADSETTKETAALADYDDKTPHSIDPVPESLSSHVVDLRGDSERFTIAYDDPDFSLYEKRSRLSWLFGFFVIFCVAATIIYHQRPDQLEPYIEKLETFSTMAFEQGMESIENVRASSFQKEISEVMVEEKQKEPPIAKVEKATEKNSDKELPVNQSSNSDKTLSVDEKPRGAEMEVADLPLSEIEEKQETRTSLSVFESDKSSDDESSDDKSADDEVNRVDFLRKKIVSLTDMYQKDATFFSELVSAYRDLLREFPEDAQAKNELNVLRETEFSEIELLANEGKSGAVNKRLTQLEYLFPEQDKAEILTLQKSLQRQQNIKKLLKEGNRLRREEFFISPANENAVAKYRQVLSYDPDHLEAKANLQALAKTLFDIAQSRYLAGRLVDAKEHLRVVLEITPKDGEAKSLYEEISGIENKRGRIRSLLETAGAQLENGNEFAPNGQGAYHLYRQVIELEGDNSNAKQGLDKTIEVFSSRVWSLVGSEKFEQAKLELRTATSNAPAFDRLKSLSEAVDEVISGKVANGAADTLSSSN